MENFKAFEPTKFKLNEDAVELALFLIKKLKEECVRQNTVVRQLIFTFDELCNELHMNVAKIHNLLQSILACSIEQKYRKVIGGVEQPVSMVFSILQYVDFVDDRVIVRFGEYFVPFAQQIELDEFRRILCKEESAS